MIEHKTARKAMMRAIDFLMESSTFVSHEYDNPPLADTLHCAYNELVKTKGFKALKSWEDDAAHIMGTIIWWWLNDKFCNPDELHPFSNGGRAVYEAIKLGGEIPKG